MSFFNELKRRNVIRVGNEPEWDYFRDDERFNTLTRPLDLNEAQQ
jgi:hypothetical protein